ncbi:alpha/beta hydrolase [Cryobacterium sp. SO2]|uniref:alpha/beta fold hydrolase n=1 Tax=Cryobacterium sp. SO2 TaxID=1897060 RepID=UPI00223D8BC7|nr:alpha/beta hydrolase [Cryobacterium sp. SO2]WEO75956.1 alpha/beta hydrolase [Cryobacterium sp. SO2]
MKLGTEDHMSGTTTGTKTGVARTHSRARKVWLVIGANVAVVAVAAVTTFAIFKHSVDSYVDPWIQKVADAGYEQKTAQVNDVNLSYVEGPDNGPPLVLLHAQLMDWFDYSRVMPDLAHDYHVFVVDYQGHGATTYPDDYPMTANQIGADLGAFMDREIGEPAFVSGNSSDGLLTTWLAANRPDIVRAAVLEDPPLFASEYPEIKNTVAIKAFKSSYDVASSETGNEDFLVYWLDYNSAFFDKNVFPGSATVIKYFTTSYREANPGEPVELNFIPDETIRLLMRGLEEYDPRFGAAFYDGSWNEGFDHAEALQKITAPTLLIHANFSTTDDGLLNGAMDQDEADQAMSLLSDGTYKRVDSEHVVHLDQPTEYVSILNDFFLDGSK